MNILSVTNIVRSAMAWTTMLAQAEVAPVGDGAGAVAPEGFAGFMSAFFANPLNVIMFAAMLFFVIVLLPQQRQMKAQQKALAQALSELKKNDRVVTASGIHGTVIQSSAEEKLVTIRIDENSGARMTINRDVIAQVIRGDK
jgi:preprotein translocase YajC subunit